MTEFPPKVWIHMADKYKGFGSYPVAHDCPQNEGKSRGRTYPARKEYVLADRLTLILAQNSQAKEALVRLAEHGNDMAKYHLEKIFGK